ncbi:ArnT family glycosyltransferase [Novispirillum sp. DQ9]|uniref:ArnT family glycosyltransferase n=1 Tax=Novispirillum sp. DQ9 TaxID=3398612 RepID=UPI003C7A9D01
MADTSPASTSAFRLTLLAVAALTAWRVAVLFGSPIDLSFDEAQYWGWAQAPAFGYFSKPPMVAWVIWLTTAIGGDGEPWVRLGSTLAHGGTALALFLVGRALFDARVGMWTALAYATLPAVSLSALLISTDPFLLLFWALALHAYVTALRGNGLGWWTLLGLWIGLGLLSKYAMVFFIVGMVLHLAWSAADRPWLRRAGPWLAVALGIVVYLPNLWWNRTHGFASYRHTGENANLKSELFNPGELAEFLGAQFGVFGPLLFAALLVLIVARFVPAMRDGRLRLLMSFTLPVLGLITAQAFLSRANANWAATAYVAATPLVVGWLWEKGRWRRVIHASVALHLLAAGVAYNLDTVQRLTGLSSGVLRKMQGWDALGEQLRAARAAHPELTLLFDDRKLMASMLYYARPVVFDAVMFRQSPGIQNHYELTTTLAGREGQDFLLVARGDDTPVRGAFDSIEPAGTLHVQVTPTHALDARLYVVRGYKGHAYP